MNHNIQLEHSLSQPQLFCHGDRSSNHGIVIAFDDSMKSYFNSGDPVLIDRSINSFISDGIYYFRVIDEKFGEMLFIRALQNCGDGYLHAHASNSDYEPWRINSDTKYEILGLVIKAWHGVLIS